MTWIRQNPYFYLALCLMVAGVLVGMWMVAEKRDRLMALKNSYETKSNQLDLLLSRKPSPTKANFEALDRNFKELYQKYERSKAILNLNTYDAAFFFEAVPATKTDAFFEIARFVEDARNSAIGNRIVFKPGSRFGFDKFSNVGPSEKDIPRIHRQVKIIKFLLVQALFESGISKFEYIKREVSNGMSDEDLARSGLPAPGSDEFSLSREWSSDIEGIVDSMAFQVAFNSQSISLRNFINIIANSSLPFVIKSVEVNLLGGDSSQRPPHASMVDNPFVNPEVGDELIKAAQIPIITENESRFVVTIEFLESVEDFENALAKSMGEEGAGA